MVAKSSLLFRPLILKILLVFVKLGLKKDVCEGDDDWSMFGDLAILSMIFGRTKNVFDVFDGESLFNFRLETL